MKKLILIIILLIIPITVGISLELSQKAILIKIFEGYKDAPKTIIPYSDFTIIQDYRQCKIDLESKEKSNCTTQPRIDYEYKGQKGILLGVQ